MHIPRTHDGRSTSDGERLVRSEGHMTNCVWVCIEVSGPREIGFSPCFVEANLVRLLRFFQRRYMVEIDWMAKLTKVLELDHVLAFGKEVRARSCD